MIPKDVIDKLNDLDIVSVIRGEGIPLKRHGANYECCCPFPSHEEKTPSFKVSIARNIYKCFGCGKGGGGAIGFIMDINPHMTFIDAVEYLARKEGIQYEQRELTAKEREQQFKHSLLIEIHKVANDFFFAQLGKSPGAKTYLKTRDVNENTQKIFSIGYATAGNNFYEHAKAKGYEDKLLLESNLVKRSENDGKIYDTFRERIMTPIFGRSGNVIAFSGRYIGKKENIPKYLNSSDTELYKKGDNLFGLFQAQRIARTNGSIVLVEGNFDVLRMAQIGVEEVVAPLGTALTDTQINLIKKCAKRVTIIGDTDAAGVNAMCKNGEALIKAGLDVNIMSLCDDGDSSIKKPSSKDPDDFFRGKKLQHYKTALADLTMEFIPWICKRKMGAISTASETAQIAVIVEIATLLCFCRDESLVDVYLNKFAKDYGNSKVWRAKFTEAKNALQREKNLKDNIGMAEMTQRYGFYEKRNCYFKAGGDVNVDKQWSNFILKPILHIKDERNAKRIYEIMNEKGEKAVIKFTQTELVSFTEFRVRIESKGNYVWRAGQGELTQLKNYLYDGTPSAEEIKQLGWQKRHEFFAWGNGGFDDGTFAQADEYGIFDMKDERFYLPGCAMDTRDNIHGYQFERKFLYAKTNNILLHDYLKKLVNVYGDHAKVGFSFLLATLFRDIIVQSQNFPLLNLFGQKGTGKTEFAHSLMSFFIPKNTPVNLISSTKAAISESIAEVSNALVHLEEYKDELELDKRELLKGVWDGSGRSKMDTESDKKRMQMSVDSGVILCGQEMTSADPALFTRVIFLTFSKDTFSKEEKARYDELRLIEKRGLTYLTGELLKLRSRVQGNFRASWDIALSDLAKKTNPTTISDRVLKNWVVILAVMKAVDGHIDLPFTYDELLNICSTMVITQQKSVRETDELANFWQTVDTLVGGNKLFNTADYHIKFGTGLESRITESKTPIILVEGKKYLYINFERLASLYAQENRATNGKTIPKNSLRYYLQKAPEFMGTANGCRFKLIESTQGYIPTTETNTKSRVLKAMIFDYDKLVEKYNINIEIEDFKEDEPKF